MNFLWSILIGAVVGALADYIVKGIEVPFLVKIFSGLILGGALGGWIFSLLGITAAI